MNIFQLIRSCIAFIFFAILIVRFVNKMFYKNNKMSARFMARTALLSALSIILYTFPFLKFSLPIFPSFLEIHLDEIPAFFAGFAYGPLSGFVVILLKTIVKIPLTTTAGVGELADFLYSFVFVVSASFIYKKLHSLKGALISLLVATFIQIIVSSFLTTFVMLDFYSSIYPGLTKEVILTMCQVINPLIKNLSFDFLLMVALPFNALKDIIVVLITLLLYKRLRLLFKKIDAQKN